MFAPEDLGSQVRITAFTLTGISTCIVALRFYCRLWVVGRLKGYDYIMAVAVLLTWGLCVANHYQILNGTGVKTEPLPADWVPPPMTPEQEKAYWDAINKMLVDGAIAWMVYRIDYVVTLGLIKISILVFYLSFATSRTLRHVTIISMIVVILFTLVSGLLNGLECPHDPGLTLSPDIYDPEKTTRCLNRPVLYYCQAAFNIFSDAWILVLPMPCLWQLRMPLFKRLSLIAVFSLGLLVPIASGVRIWSLYLWSNSGMEGQYYGGFMLLWTQIEINTAIICASVPSLQPIFKRIFGRLMSFRGGSYYYYGDGTRNNNNVREHQNPVGGRALGYGNSVSIGRGNSIDAPSPIFSPNKRSTGGTDNELMVIQETPDEEERIRGRIRHFASQGSLGGHDYQGSLADSQYHAVSTPERPKEMLSYG